MDLRTLSDDELRAHTPISGGAPDYWIAHMKEVTRRFFDPKSDSQRHEDNYDEGYGDCEEGSPHRFR